MGKITDRYNEMKQEHPKHIVFMHIGDFYETYDADANVCKEVLGLTLNQRNGKAQLITGFPKHAYSAYISRLHDAGYNICICEDFQNEKISNNNQTMTMDKKIFRTISCGVRYMYNQEMQSLVEVRPLREVFNLNNGKATQEWRVANTDAVMTTHYEPATDEEPEKFDGEMYHTFDDFEKGKKMPIDDVFYQPRKEDHICNCLMKCGNRYLGMDDKGAYCWIYENGQAVKWYFRGHINTVTWEYSEKGQTTVTSDCGCELPEAYSSSEEVYKYNDYRFVDAEGNEEVREGVYKRLKLEPDQEKLAEKLQQVLEECKAAGMKVYFSNTHYDLRAVNQRKVEQIAYDPEYDEETEQAFEFDDRRVSHVFSGVYDLNIEDSDVKFVIKKKQEA